MNSATNTDRAPKDLSRTLTEVLGRHAGLHKRLHKEPVPFVHAGDGMYADNDAYYLQTGISALNAIYASLNAADVQPDQVSAVMDYACGYGRVTRWLQATFAKSSLYAGDLDPKAVAAVSSLMGAQTVQLTKDLSLPLPGKFDLIWVGSLVTHLKEEAVQNLLQFLGQSLTQTGVLVVTAHGDYVADRIRRREKSYNLAESEMQPLLAAYENTGFAFAPYPGEDDYGISINTPAKLTQMACEAGLELVRFEKKGWVKHQDCFAFIKART